MDGENDMIEVEIKLKVTDRTNLLKKLEENGFVESHLVRETDTYFNGVDRDFKKSDEALRVRKTECLEGSYLNADFNLAGGRPGQMACITYKGSKMGETAMSRRELEITVEDAEGMIEMLILLGYQPVRPVVKLRRYLYSENMVACVDRVEGLGTYLELEIMVETEAERQTALDMIELQLRTLGYSMEDTTRISYLSMLQAKNIQ